MQSNKEQPRWDRWLPRVGAYLRKWSARQGRIVYRQALRGAAYSVGSGAVSLLIVWLEARH